MTKHNAENERIKRSYFIFLKEAKQLSEPSVDAAAKALSRFEEYTRHRDFKAFHSHQAVAFKRHLAGETGQRLGKKLSKATQHLTLKQLKKFFEWLAMQPGYKARLHDPDAQFFNLSDKDVRVATAHRERPSPTLEQVRHVIEAMPDGDEIARRNRALVAFTLLTGARGSAIASIKLKHVDLKKGCVYQDAREVKTKFSKSFTTYFFRWVTAFGKLWPNGCGFYGKRSYEAMTIHSSRQRALRWEQIVSLRQMGWIESTGAQQRRFERSFVRHSSGRACRTFIRTACVKRWPGWVSKSASRRKSSRRGARTWGMSRY